MNEVVGGNASQLLGYTEVAGQKAEVVIANPDGIYCNGCGFINTSRGIFTTGRPVFGGLGSLDAFHVTGGEIQIGTAGLDGSNVDAVDLIARAVAINGKIWAGQSLNVVTGNNDVRHSDLNAQSLGPDGNSPGVAIDVAQLGGMYAGKIMLVGTEKGVGVNSTGTIASQSGDLQLSSDGKVTFSGSTSANGNVVIAAADDVTNSGSIYATQSTTLNSQGQVGNSGTIAALGNTAVTGATVNSTGSLGAGIDANGNVTGTGSLAVTGSGGLTAAGRQMAGGNLALSGSSLNMAGGQTLAQGNAILTATGAGGDTGNIVHTGATLQVNGSLTANAAGSFTNDPGQISAAQLSVTAGGISNRSGTLSQTGTGVTTLAASGAFDNTGGTVTTNAQNTTIRSGSLTNANGTISQAGTAALTIQTGALDNSHGSIGTNGNATISAASLTNSGTLTAAQDLGVTSSGILDNSGGSMSGATLEANAASLKNEDGTIGANTVWLTAPQLDNSNGKIVTNQLDVSATNLTNEGGSITQLGSGAMDLGVSGALDNSNGGVIQSNSTDLTLASASVSNDGGTITHAGTGSLANVGGRIVTNGQASISVDSLDNTGGTLAAQGMVAASVRETLKNTNGRLSSGHDLVFTMPGSFSNSGTLSAVNGLDIHAGNIENAAALTAGGLLTTHSNTLTNTGTIVGGSVALHATQILSNLGMSALIGATDSAGTLKLLAPDIENRDDTTATDTQATTAIYGLGKVVLAGGKDAGGNYIHANLIHNQSALIQSTGDMTVDANQVTNTRRVMTTSGLTSSIDPALLAGLGISMSGCTAIHMAACSGQSVGWVTTGDPTMIGGAFTVPPHGGQWNSGYQYTTYIPRPRRLISALTRCRAMSPRSRPAGH